MAGKKKPPRIQFTSVDLRTPDDIERVLRRFEAAIPAPVEPFQLPPFDQLAALLAPFIRDQLQASGDFPLNLQNLLPIGSTGLVLTDTHANRLTIYPPNNFGLGQLFYESDRTSFYKVTLSSGAKVWSWVAGLYANTLANIPTDLGTNDTGFLYEVTDYDHILQRTSSAWTWGPGDVGSGYYQLFEDAPNSVGANAWQICDGTAVARLNADGTTTSVTTPNLATAAYLKGGTSSAAVAAASGTTANTTATNQNESAHTHAVDPPSTASGAPSATVAVQAGAGTTVATDTHTHTTDIASFSSGAGSAHTHIQDAHNHGPGTLELRNKQARLYFRR